MQGRYGILDRQVTCPACTRSMIPYRYHAGANGYYATCTLCDHTWSDVASNILLKASRCRSTESLQQFCPDLGREDLAFLRHYLRAPRGIPKAIRGPLVQVVEECLALSLASVPSS